MKEIRITLENIEHEKIIKIKKEKSWHDYLCQELNKKEQT